MTNIELIIKMELEVRSTVPSFKTNGKLDIENVDYFIENGMEEKYTNSIIAFSYLDGESMLRPEVLTQLILKMIFFIRDHQDYSNNIVKLNKVSFLLNSFDVITSINSYYKNVSNILKSTDLLKEIDPKFEYSEDKVNYVHKFLMTIE